MRLRGPLVVDHGLKVRLLDHVLTIFDESIADANDKLKKVKDEMSIL